MRLLAAVGVDLLVASDLLNQVGQEERANMGRQRSGRGGRNEVLETGRRLDGAGFSETVSWPCRAITYAG